MTEAPPEWIQQASPKRTHGWDDWTDEMRAAIDEAIAWRAKGWRVSAQQVADQIGKLGGHATKNLVNSYCCEVLGRKSLASP